jgi:hypothetical protein
MTHAIRIHETGGMSLLGAGSGFSNSDGGLPISR